MGQSIMEQVKAAKAVVPDISVDEAAGMLGADNVLFVDVRDGDEQRLVRRHGCRRRAGRCDRRGLSGNSCRGEADASCDSSVEAISFGKFIDSGCQSLPPQYRDYKQQTVAL